MLPIISVIVKRQKLLEDKIFPSKTFCALKVNSSRFGCKHRSLRESCREVTFPCNLSISELDGG